MHSKAAVYVSFTVLVLLIGGWYYRDFYHPRLKVLVIGDSISIGYGYDLDDVLPGEYKAVHACGNDGCNNGHSGQVAKEMNSWFTHHDYDIITFNVGLHDSQGIACDWEKPTPFSERRTDLQTYETNLQKIASYLRSKAKVVIWVDTTAIPTGAPCELPGDQRKYNEVAERVANQHHFYILRLDGSGQLPANVHFSPEGYRHLAEQVSECIQVAGSGKSTAACIKPHN